MGSGVGKTVSPGFEGQSLSMYDFREMCMSYYEITKKDEAG